MNIWGQLHCERSEAISRYPIAYIKTRLLRFARNDETKIYKYYEVRLNKFVELLKEAARAADSKKATNIVILDVNGVCDFAGYFLICCGDNLVHIQAVADTVIESFKKAGRKPDHVEGYGTTGWILLDYGDVVVHIFLEEVPQYSGLELIWGDTPKVPWEVE